MGKFFIKKADEILNDMLDRVNDEYDKTEGSLFYDNLAPISLEFENMYGIMNKMFLNSFVDTAQGEYLDKIANEVGINRKKATKSKGYVKIIGVPNTIIKRGTKVATDNTIYETTEEVEIADSGEVYVPIESTLTGSIYNTSKNTIINFPVTIPNLNTVTNEEPTTDGYDEETDEELRERYYFKVREPVTSGNVYHYKKWALEVEGVGGAKVFPLWNGAGTVKVVVVDSNMKTANSTLIRRVKEYIESVRPIGATVTVEGAKTKAIKITSTLKVGKNVNFENIKEEVKNIIQLHFKKVGFEQGYVSYARIGNLILNVTGIIDYKDLKLNNKTTNVELTNDEIPSLESLEFNKEVV